MLAFTTTLDHPEMVGVNPEVAHEHMSSLNFIHGVAQAWEAGKLFHCKKGKGKSWNHPKKSKDFSRC